MKIAGCDRALPICPLNDELNIAGFVIFGDPELTTACADGAVAALAAVQFCNQKN